MTILFLILKIIGIIILTLLGLVLFICCSLLFFPAFYRVKGSLEQTTKIETKISCFYHLLGLSLVYYDGILKTYLRILFFKKEIVTDKESTEELQQKKNFTSESVKEETVHHETITDAVHENSSPKESDPNIYLKNKQKHVKKHTSLLQRIQMKLHHLKANYEKYKKILTDTRNKNSFVFLKGQVFDLLKKILPKKSKINISFSLGSPDYTGQLLGVLCLFPMGYKNRWNVYPDFESEKKYVTGVIDIKGRIFLFQLLKIAFKVMLNKDMKRLYKMLNR